jgi:hypothetical protein
MIPSIEIQLAIMSAECHLSGPDPAVQGRDGAILAQSWIMIFSLAF